MAEETPEPTQEGEPWHGTVGGYSYRRCRCEACKDARREYGRAHPRTRPKATAEQRSMAGQIAALTRWSREDPADQAQRMQDGQMEKFRREVLEHDPDVVEPELTRRAIAARKAHMRRLALLSSKARTKRKES